MRRQGGQMSGPEVSRRQEMKHDGLTKEPADIINADQSAATFEQHDQTGAVGLSKLRSHDLSLLGLGAVQRTASIVYRYQTC